MGSLAFQCDRKFRPVSQSSMYAMTNPYLFSTCSVCSLMVGSECLWALGEGLKLSCRAFPSRRSSLTQTLFRLWSCTFISTHGSKIATVFFFLRMALLAVPRCCWKWYPKWSHSYWVGDYTCLMRFQIRMWLHTAQCKMLLFCVKTTAIDWSNFELRSPSEERRVKMYIDEITLQYHFLELRIDCTSLAAGLQTRHNSICITA